MNYVRFGDIATSRKGKKPTSLTDNPDEIHTIPYVDIKAFEKGQIDNYSDGTNVVPCEEGDLLLVWDGSRSGLVGRAKRGVICSTLARIESIQATQPYLYYFLVSKFQDLNTRQRGSGTPHVDPNVLWNFELYLPDRIEQEKIVSKIEELFSDLDKNIASLSDDLKRCESLRSSIIEYSFMRAGGKKIKLSEVTEVITDGDHQAPPKAATGVPFIVISNIQNNRVLLSKASRYVPSSYYEALKDSRKAKTGDVLYTVTGSYGIPALVEDNNRFCFQRHIALLRPNASMIDPRYLLYALQTDSVYKQATAIATGTAQLTVPLTGLRKIDIDMIPIKDQQNVVKQVEAKLSELDALRSTIQDSIRLARNMRQSILTKAFKGELI